MPFRAPHPIALPNTVLLASVSAGEKRQKRVKIRVSAPRAPKLKINDILIHYFFPVFFKYQN